MKKNTITKIIAGLAFLGIVVSIVGTGLLIIFNNPEPIELTPEQIQEIIDAQSGSLSQTGTLSGSGNNDVTNLEIGEINTEMNISE